MTIEIMSFLFFAHRALTLNVDVANTSHLCFQCRRHVRNVEKLITGCRIINFSEYLCL